MEKGGIQLQAVGGIWQDMFYDIRKFRQQVAGTYIGAGIHGQKPNCEILIGKRKSWGSFNEKWEEKKKKQIVNPCSLLDYRVRAKPAAIPNGSQGRVLSGLGSLHIPKSWETNLVQNTYQG